MPNVGELLSHDVPMPIREMTFPDVPLTMKGWVAEKLVRTSISAIMVSEPCGTLIAIYPLLVEALTVKVALVALVMVWAVTEPNPATALKVGLPGVPVVHAVPTPVTVTVLPVEA
jgi:hypothetical protein